MNHSMLTFDSLKKDSWNQAWNVGIELPENPNLRLVPVGEWILGHEELIEAFADWRWNARDMFFARFPRSVDSMRDYLVNVSLKKSDVILFVICDQAGSPHGHIGLTHASRNSAEIDSVMRATDVRTPGMMQDALLALEAFARDEYEIGELTLKVVSTNDRAVRLYAESGYIARRSVALNLEVNGQYSKHAEVPDNESNVTYRSVEMVKPLVNTRL